MRCIEAGAEDDPSKPFNLMCLQACVRAPGENRMRDPREQIDRRAQQEERCSETLLENMPPQIVDRMRGGEVVIADRVAEATILFCDLVGFTALSHELSADRIIDFLSQDLLHLRRLAAEQGVEKIKTIGDAYMVAAGIPEAQETTRYASPRSRCACSMRSMTLPKPPI